MKKVLIGAGILGLVLTVAIKFSVKSAQGEPPVQLATNFVDLDKITRVSKFRSCAGHVTVPQDGRESKRSMKHYFQVKSNFVGTDAVKIYAPYDGYVSAVRSDPAEGLEGEVWLVPKRALPMLPPFGVWQFSIQHIIVRGDLRRGSEVKAGEVLGYAAIPKSDRATFDVVYAKQALAPKTIDNWNSPFSDLDSVFNHMSGNVLAEYQQNGLDKGEVIMSKEERDQRPCAYRDGGPYFMGDSPDNWVVLH